MFKGPKPPGQPRSLRSIAESKNNPASFRNAAVEGVPEQGTPEPANPPAFTPRQRGAEATPFTARGGK